MDGYRIVVEERLACHGCGRRVYGLSGPLAYCKGCKHELRVAELLRKLGALTAGFLVFGASWVIAVIISRIVK